MNFPSPRPPPHGEPCVTLPSHGPIPAPPRTHHTHPALHVPHHTTTTTTTTNLPHLTELPHSPCFTACS
ncbi:hypothetical protein E2C01_079266 [Portunus trituberculatus]|uniref:Uncharacterized protein n=1 Tax=Portunus trituberculatus TaxID=210409 RepID=A0A5B7ISV9_PORTR|nr:hypothetical protein [Portunus trituberculatus]